MRLNKSGLRAEDFELKTSGLGLGAGDFGLKKPGLGLGAIEGMRDEG